MSIPLAPILHLAADAAKAAPGGISPDEAAKLGNDALNVATAFFGIHVPTGVVVPTAQVLKLAHDLIAFSKGGLTVEEKHALVADLAELGAVIASDAAMVVTASTA